MSSLHQWGKNPADRRPTLLAYVHTPSHRHTMGQLTLWKGVRDAAAPSAPMGCAARPPREATSHSGRAPHKNTPLWLGPRVCGAGTHARG